jgi:hypothetical protein
LDAVIEEIRAALAAGSLNPPPLSSSNRSVSTPSSMAVHGSFSPSSSVRSLINNVASSPNQSASSVASSSTWANRWETPSSSTPSFGRTPGVASSALSPSSSSPLFKSSYSATSRVALPTQQSQQQQQQQQQHHVHQHGGVVNDNVSSPLSSPNDRPRPALFGSPLSSNNSNGNVPTTPGTTRSNNGAPSTPIDPAIQ